MEAALNSVYDACADQVPQNTGRLEQLRSALGTAQMAVTYLFTETPYNI